MKLVPDFHLSNENFFVVFDVYIQLPSVNQNWLDQTNKCSKSRQQDEFETDKSILQKILSCTSIKLKKVLKEVFCKKI